MNYPNHFEKFPIGSKVAFKPSISEWYLNNAYDLFKKPSTGEIAPECEAEFDTLVVLMMAHQLGEEITGTVMGYGDNDCDEGCARVEIRSGDLYYESYFGTNSMLPIDESVLPDANTEYFDLRQEIAELEHENSLLATCVTETDNQNNKLFLRNDYLEKKISKLESELTREKSIKFKLKLFGGSK